MIFSKIVRGSGSWLVGAIVMWVAATAHAATITIVNNDGAGEGFNDTTLRASVGGNTGTTLGAQRLFVFQHAAGIWGALLPSNVEILVRANFDPLTCTSTSALLGSAGPFTIHRDFANAPFSGTWYHKALANKLANTNQAPGSPDITANFNLTLDDGMCLGGTTWYYGIDGNEGTKVELLPVVLHELGHGLGFSSTTSGTTGDYYFGFPGAFDHFLLDNSLGLRWNQMSSAQRAASAVALDHLVWDGPSAVQHAAAFLGPRPQLVIHSPGGLAGTYVAQSAAFGAQSFSLTRDVVLVTDAGATDPNDACESITNGPAISGKIALINRGTCSFAAKCAAAQAAGAAGVLIANNVSPGPTPMGGSDPTITIPCMGLTLADGDAIKSALLSGTVNVTMGFNSSVKAGADANGRPLMYSPNPFQGGSSVSHWDVSMSPNALMEPAINGNLHDSVDLTYSAFKDLGWTPLGTPVSLQDFAAEGREDGIELRWHFGDPAEVGSITIERSPAAAGPWGPVAAGVRRDGAAMRALDATVEPGVTHYYRLQVTDRAGDAAVMGLVSAQRSAVPASRLVLRAPVPNPAPGGTTSVSFRVPSAQKVTLSVHDAAGREVRGLIDGGVTAGEHVALWDGRSNRGLAAPAGVYFIRMRTSTGSRTQRVTLLR